MKAHMHDASISSSSVSESRNRAYSCITLTDSTGSELELFMHDPDAMKEIAIKINAEAEKLKRKIEDMEQSEHE